MHSELSLKQISKIMEQNDAVTYVLSRYLNYDSRFLSDETVKSFATECELDDDSAFRVLFSAACGLDTAENREHRQMERDYFQVGLTALDPAVYQSDPYYQTIRISAQKNGQWELCHSHYEPFEPFVCGHPIVTEKFLEIPRIGYFKSRFDFPAVLENGIEWMTITPNEIETMKEPIADAHGKVLTLGLGLGYYAFMVSEKESVESITVVEKDEHVIKLFQTVILPQFPNRQKVRIVHADAFEYLQTDAKKEGFDYVFADLWHDQSDGLPLYLRLRRMESDYPGTTFSYWIEPTILSSLRHMVFDKLTDPNAAVRLADVPLSDFLSDAFLKKLAPDIKKIE